MLKQKRCISIAVLFALLILVISVPVSATQKDAQALPATLQCPDSATPLYYGRHPWHHHYSRHGHSHRHLRPHEHAHHRHCRYFEYDGLYHYPIHHR